MSAIVSAALNLGKERRVSGANKNDERTKGLCITHLCLQLLFGLPPDLRYWNLLLLVFWSRKLFWYFFNLTQERPATSKAHHMVIKAVRNKILLQTTRPKKIQNTFHYVFMGFPFWKYPKFCGSVQVNLFSFQDLKIRRLLSNEAPLFSKMLRVIQSDLKSA